MLDRGAGPVSIEVEHLRALRKKDQLVFSQGKRAAPSQSSTPLTLTSLALLFVHRLGLAELVLLLNRLRLAFGREGAGGLDRSLLDRDVRRLVAPNDRGLLGQGRAGAKQYRNRNESRPFHMQLR